MTLNASHRVRRGRYLAPASALVCLLAGSPSLAEEHEHAPGVASSEASQLDAQTAPVAQRLWTDLVCLCGRCARLTLASCRCPDGAAERKKVLELLRGHDLSSPSGSEAAYQAVVQAYITRFDGRRVLASEGTGPPAAPGPPWALLGGLIAALVGGIVLIELARKRRGHSNRRSRSRHGR